MTGDSKQPAPPSGGGNWSDLGTRVVSGVILALLGLGLLLSSGVVLNVGVSILVGLMMWELARLTGHLDQPERNARHALLTGITAGLAAVAALIGSDIFYPYQRWFFALTIIPLVIGWLGAVPRNRWPFLLFALAIHGAALGILILRSNSVGAVLWIAGIVVVSDVMGYFAGRTFGGPKFWPAISPKKTWSGTIAGWIGAVIFALIVQLARGDFDLSLLAVAPLVAFAGQMGDIAESWLKRRVGVKDSSNLIPGHGGVLDRFDAMSGAFVLVALGYLALMALFMAGGGHSGG